MILINFNLEISFLIIYTILYIFIIEFSIFRKYKEKIKFYESSNLRKLDLESHGIEFKAKWFKGYHKKFHKLEEEIEDNKTKLKYCRWSGLLILALVGIDVLFTNPFFQISEGYYRFTDTIGLVFIFVSIAFMAYFYEIIYSMYTMNKRLKAQQK
jgi:hypothetical protein